LSWIQIADKITSIKICLHPLCEGGFKRLMKGGFIDEKWPLLITSQRITGPGHAISLYSTNFPATHGIISNGWYCEK